MYCVCHRSYKNYIFSRNKAIWILWKFRSRWSFECTYISYNILKASEFIEPVLTSEGKNLSHLRWESFFKNTDITYASPYNVAHKWDTNFCGGLITFLCEYMTRGASNILQNWWTPPWFWKIWIEIRHFSLLYNIRRPRRRLRWGNVQQKSPMKKKIHRNKNRDKISISRCI